MDGEKEKIHFWRGSIFRKILLILLVFSSVLLVFSVFLTVSSYQSVISNLQAKGLLAPEEISHIQQNVLMQIFLILLLLIIFIVFISILVNRNITKPLLVLVKGVKEVTGGNMEVKFKVTSKDELGALASAFNEMVVRLKEQKKREDLAAKLKSEFMSIAAHQLRTPLSSIKWIIKMVLDGDMGKINLQQRDFMEKAYSSNERMIALVNDLLNVTRIEEGRFGFEFSSVNITKFVEEIVPNFKQQARMKNLNFVYKPLKDPLVLVIDPQRMKIAFSNLLDNAMHYTPIRGTVELSMENKSNFLEITVKDTGVGIPKNQRNRIFTKFFRAENVVKMQTEGTGLGLYLTKNIIEKHGGQIWFESEVGKGTTFHFTLPKTKDKIAFFPDSHV